MSTLSLSSQLLHAIQDVVNPNRIHKEIALHEPYFRDTKSASYVQDCIDTGWVSSAGAWVPRFEAELCAITGSSHAIALANGTAALRLALHVIGVKSHDEVLTTSLTFVATSNAISHLGATPHFVDVESQNLGLCPNALATRLETVAERRGGHVFNKETGSRISAVCIVHVFGHPALTNDIRKVCDYWGLPLIEDAAEALGSFRDNKHCGLFGQIGILSFNGNKLITTGGGGALLTNDTEIAQRARHLSTTAKRQHAWEFEHDAIGWNDRMPNLNAAIGVGQLEVLEDRLNLKRMLFKKYLQSFSGIDGVKLLSEPPSCRSNYWLITFKLMQDDLSEVLKQRNHILQTSHEAGLFLRPIWRPLHLLPMYLNAPRGSLQATMNNANRLISLPSSPQLMQVL